MSEEIKLHEPWLVAVWPGMGNVALTAGYYLMAKLEMKLFAEFSPRELFDVEHVVVKEGVILPGHMPRSRLFVWHSPERKHDLVLFIGEAQPPLGKYAFCRQLIQFANQLGVQRVFTFAAMATDMRPEATSRIFTAATDKELVEELRRHDMTVLEGGQIGGLNGILLGAAAEAGVRGGCLLGEMPQIFAQLPFPKASLAVLKVFTEMAEVKIDFAELAEQSAAIEEQLREVLNRLEEQAAGQAQLEEESVQPEPSEEPGLPAEDARRVESLFEQAAGDRSKAYELKRELDRLNVFKDYEDRFLDLFRKSD